MQEFQSTEAKNKWGVISDTALQEPVAITRHGRPALVVTSVRDYEQLQKIKYEKLRGDVQAGFQSLERGEYGTMTLEEIKAEGRRRLEAMQTDVPG